jgi:hypothetical protein
MLSLLVPGREVSGRRELQKIFQQFANSGEASLVRNVVEVQLQLATDFSSDDDFESLPSDKV